MSSRAKEKRILLVANVAKEHVLKFHLPTMRRLAQRGWIVDVACHADEPVPDCHRLYPMPWKRNPFAPGSLQGIRKLKKIIDEGDYAVVYCHTPMGGLAGRLAGGKARKRGTRVIYCAHGFHFYNGAPVLNWLVIYPIEKMLARKTDVIFTMNREDYGTAKSRFTKKVVVESIPGMGADCSRIAVADRKASRQKIREEFGISDQTQLMIYVAEQTQNKNQKMLIDALSVLLKEGRDVCLLLPGPDHVDGAHERYARQKGVADRCFFLGWRDDIGDLLAASDVYTASSCREGFTINLLEAQVAKLPVVATDNRAHRMIIEDGKNGFLVPLGDADAMADRIGTILDTSPFDLDRIAKEAERYDSRRVAEELSDLIEKYAGCGKEPKEERCHSIS